MFECRQVQTRAWLGWPRYVQGLLSLWSGRSKQTSPFIWTARSGTKKTKKKVIPKRKVLTRCKYRYKMVEGQSSLWKGGINYPTMDIEMQPKRPRKTGVRNERLFKCFASGLYFVFRKTSNPQAPFDDALHGLKLIFCTGVNETEEALNDSCCSAVALEVDK